MQALKDGMKLSKIYQGGVLQWEKPRVECEIERFFIGLETINGLAYPQSSTVCVEVKRGGKVIYENCVEKSTFAFSLTVPNLEKLDAVTVEVRSSGYRTYRQRQLVRY